MQHRYRITELLWVREKKTDVQKDKVAQAVSQQP